jgi:hypothetical protein
MRIKPSFFDYGGEIHICYTYPIDDIPARLCIRRVKNRYELYARTYYPIQAAETVIVQGSLEEVVKRTNALMLEYFGPSWEADVIEPEG